MFAGKRHQFAFIGQHGAAEFSGIKYTPSNSNKKLATLPTSSGRGDTGGGDNMPGNTHNAVGNAQRDGQVRDMRVSNPGKRSGTGKTLESKKKNKSN